MAVVAALSAKDEPMAAALARRGDERFGGVFAQAMLRANQQLSSRGGADWLFLGGVMILLWVSFRQAKRHVRRGRGRDRTKAAARGLAA